MSTCGTIIGNDGKVKAKQKRLNACGKRCGSDGKFRKEFVGMWQLPDGYKL
jgi:hypothetical protein